jgi:hypothetical protein
MGWLTQSRDECFDQTFRTSDLLQVRALAKRRPLNVLTFRFRFRLSRHPPVTYDGETSVVPPSASRRILATIWVTFLLLDEVWA